jgi:hypothetical protein
LWYKVTGDFGEGIMLLRSRWTAAFAVFAATVGLVISCGSQNSAAENSEHGSARRTEKSAPKPEPHRPTTPSTGYYVDFRTIDGFVYGHTHIAYGRLSVRGQPINVRYAGFEPQGGGFGLALGHFAGVAGSIVTSKESVNFPIIDSYRRRLTAQQYKALMAAVERAKKQTPQWNVVHHNCNAFVGEMASAVGLRVPSSLMHPYMYIAAMRSLNEP